MKDIKHTTRLRQCTRACSLPSMRCQGCARQFLAITASNTSRPLSTTTRRAIAVERDGNGHIDVRKLLSTPTWSVASLLPSKAAPCGSPRISSKQLHHLLRLSALPPPRDAEEEARMLTTLSSQLHFVREIQKVDTASVEPLRSLRDETSAGAREAEMDLEALKGALQAEEVRGKYHKRIRRRRDAQVDGKEEAWDSLATASRKVGRYFVVEGGARVK